ncbi:class I SAM-dependent methyltransferase [Microlunatus flavus]|uniref:2-polyprenyl-3-methyl-5-hydroxy-6-metoxy-1,4-benzoquinol methylase n=1 Tax=Microlunatus flavus TaxID=1036181 RepID=A0A1H9G5M6_9ACTN|nr:class I SAM-dependent methyltransferase [Microlunatus flavus]SEQ45088.1 2-polyprenyl-3-methyl-5-hydroxy-6-metoxy-1,4-benzoquinol methylase [Microlunatus flavus]
MSRFAHRDTEVVELMDDPACDLALLERTYAQFRVVNRLVSGWRRLWARELAPVLATSPRPSLLDVGFGGGDVAVDLAAWARRDGIPLEVTAVDPDPRATAYVARRPRPDGVTFRQATSHDLVEEGRRFDVVVSNHVLHHLDDDALQQLLADGERLATRLALHNDLRRSRLAHGAYGVATAPLARTSFLRTDGLRSIRRSHAPAELAGVRPGWRAEPFPPFRLLLRHDAPGEAG